MMLRQAFLFALTEFGYTEVAKLDRNVYLPNDHVPLNLEDVGACEHIYNMLPCCMFVSLTISKVYVLSYHYMFYFKWWFNEERRCC